MPIGGQFGEWLRRNDSKCVGMANNGDVIVLFEPANSPEIFEAFTCKDEKIIFNKHLVTFATCEVNPDGNKCACNARIGLNDLIYDEAEYNFCSPRAPWIITEMWPSDGSNGEEKGAYYAKSTKSSQKYLMELHSMVF